MRDPLGPESRHRSRAKCTRRALLAGLLVGILPNTAHGEDSPPALEDVPTIGRPHGRPRIRIDRLTFPSDIPGAAEYVRHLRRALQQEARRADWGAGKGSTIVFRFVVEELTWTDQGSAIQVRCSARGELPKRRTARSRLVYGGDPRKRRELVKRVLTIVARGVVTRLADLERSRRER